MGIGWIQVWLAQGWHRAAGLLQRYRRTPGQDGHRPRQGAAGPARARKGVPPPLLLPPPPPPLMLLLLLLLLRALEVPAPCGWCPCSRVAWLLPAGWPAPTPGIHLGARAGSPARAPCSWTCPRPGAAPEPCLRMSAGVQPAAGGGRERRPHQHHCRAERDCPCLIRPHRPQLPRGAPKAYQPTGRPAGPAASPDFFRAQSSMLHLRSRSSCCGCPACPLQPAHAHLLALMARAAGVPCTQPTCRSADRTYAASTARTLGSAAGLLAALPHSTGPSPCRRSLALRALAQGKRIGVWYDLVTRPNATQEVHPAPTAVPSAAPCSCLLPALAPVLPWHRLTHSDLRRSWTSSPRQLLTWRRQVRGSCRHWPPLLSPVP